MDMLQLGIQTPTKLALYLSLHGRTTFYKFEAVEKDEIDAICEKIKEQFPGYFESSSQLDLDWGATTSPLASQQDAAPTTRIGSPSTKNRKPELKDEFSDLWDPSYHSLYLYWLVCASPAFLI